MQAIPLHDLIAATGGTAVGLSADRTEVLRIETDSRRVKSGDLFWALRGSKHDGHKFVKQALQQGAFAAIVSEEQAARIAGPHIVVDDTLAALWRLANWYRKQFETLVIGVTGSVGKTTTRRMIAAVLSARFHGIDSPGNFNNHFGVPLSLLQLEADHEFAVIELGASSVGEIAALAAVAEPEVGAITAVGPAHLDEFASIDNIARTKQELLESLPETGFAVLNGDDKRVAEMQAAANCRVIMVGEREHNDFRAVNVTSGNGTLKFEVGGSRFEAPVVGRHHLNAALTAIVIGREFEMSDAEIAAGLRSYRSLPGRSHLLQIGEWTVIDDTYNANPLSMSAACRTLRDWETPGRKFLVTGDMLHLGDWSNDFHRMLGEEVARAKIDHLLAIGSQANVVTGSARKNGLDAGCQGLCRDHDLALMLLDCWLQPGDVVLVKGSRNMKMESILEGLQRLSERQRDNLDRKAA